MFCIFILFCISCVYSATNENTQNESNTAIFKVYKKSVNGSYSHQIDVSEVKGLRESSFMLNIIGKQTFSIEIKRNRELVNSKYHSYKKKKAVQDADCYFSGSHGDIYGAFSFCDGISGVIYSADDTWKILSDESGNGRLISIKNNSLINGCGVNHPKEEKSSSAKIWDKTAKAEASQKSGPSGYHGNITFHGSSEIHWRRYVELWVVVDRSLYEYLGSDDRTVHRACTQIINIANTIYKPLLISVVLVGVEIWKTRDKIRVQPNYQKLLGDFESHRQSMIQNRKYHDYTILLTAVDLALARDFNSDVVGYANVREMCSDARAVAVVEYQKRDSYELTAGVVAHEMGHGLGAKHDDRFCLSHHGKIGVMAGSSSTHHFWSNCSLIYLAQYIDGFSCLENIPTLPPQYPFCGNGQIDHGEQCDCGGLSGSCQNCCHSNNCTLKIGATCGTGDCCDMKTCSPKALGTECRSSMGECDLPEYCSGGSEKCPKDYHKMDGTQCGSHHGHCVSGKCGSRDHICKSLINEGALSAKDDELEKLKRFYGGNECQDIFCRPLLNIFDGSKRTLRLLTSYQYSDTHLILVNQTSRLYPRLNGVPCGENRICLNDFCRRVPQMRSDACLSNCSGNGICNSNQNCHCDVGFGPPYCNTTGYGGSIDSGHASNPQDNTDVELICFYVILGGVPLTIFLCCLWPFLQDQWQKTWRSSMHPVLPTLTKILDSCCCPCMSFLTYWIRLILKKEELKDMASSERRYSDTRRPTICEVGVNLLPEEPKWQSWGVADSMLATDVITITPKSSPDTRRKIRLPSDSPILRTCSDEKIYRPPLSQAISHDSGCMSGDESVETSSINFNSSMGSLVSLFNKFGRQKSKHANEDTDPDSPPLAPKFKPPNLRRMVVDPLSNHKLSRQRSSEGEDSPRTPFRRSISEDPSLSTKLDVPRKPKVTFTPVPEGPRPAHRPPPPPPAIRPPRTHAKTNPKSNSESIPERPTRSKVKDLAAKFQ